MRLLNTSSFALELFSGEPPSYAILSHRWEEDEVTFHDMLSLSDAKSKKGFAKVEKSAKKARKEGYNYIWIDTCCIDKSSSAELSEAINSMFQWYQNATCCFVYMSDVSSSNNLPQSRWFSRGWTLQELVAPKEVHFFDKGWSSLGTKRGLAGQLEGITGISQAILLGADLGTIPVCHKMAWAAERVTTRPEDIAYCLFGLLGVNMPLLYGEGSERAFQRLQEEFIKQSDDESIFAWSTTTEEAIEKPYWGLLAPSPVYFKNSRPYTIPHFKVHREGRPTEITNRGLGISFALLPLGGDSSETQYLAPLNCSSVNRNGDDVESAFTITLQMLSRFERQYARVRPDQLIGIGAALSSASDASNRETSTSQFFVRSTPRVADPAAGFCVESKQFIPFQFQSNTPYGMKTLPGRVDAVFDGNYPTLTENKSDMKHILIHLNKENTGLNPDDFSPKKLGKRVIVGCMRLNLSGWFGRESVAGQQHGAQRTIFDRVQPRPSYQDPFIVMGFEPLLPNSLDTPPGYIRPWYSFTTSDEQHILEELVLPEAELKLSYTAPGGTNIGIKWLAMTHRFRTFYEAHAVNYDDK